jgi:hypothetical protein
MPKIKKHGVTLWLLLCLTSLLLVNIKVDSAFLTILCLLTAALTLLSAISTMKHKSKLESPKEMSDKRKVGKSGTNKVSKNKTQGPESTIKKGPQKRTRNMEV